MSSFLLFFLPRSYFWFLFFCSAFSVTAHLTYAATSDDIKSGVVGAIQENAEQKESAIILGARFDYDTATAFKVDIQYNDEETVNGADGDSGILYAVGMSLVF